MKELSLNIMDIVQNSVAAKSTLIKLDLNEQPENDYLEFSITDNGCGMDEEMLRSVTDPFMTGRTTRRVGLGIPLLKHAAEITGGEIKITSELGVGTVVFAKFGYHHIDREPLGDMAETMHQIITSYEEIDFVYTHRFGKKKFVLDTVQLKKFLNGVSLKTPEVTLWLLEYLKETEAGFYSDGVSENTGKE